MDTPRPSPRTNRTRRVPHPVLIGHAASLTQVFSGVGVGGVAAALPRARKAESGPAGYDPYSHAGGYGSTLVNSMDP